MSTVDNLVDGSATIKESAEAFIAGSPDVL